jgi:hypothetical protein
LYKIDSSIVQVNIFHNLAPEYLRTFFFGLILKNSLFAWLRLLSSVGEEFLPFQGYNILYAI